MNELIPIKTMSSLQIAEHTGKQHKDVLKSIRAMEPAWEKVSGRKFALAEYLDEQGKPRPMYALTKRETLFVSTKFNDEARAKLILRWEELEILGLTPYERIELTAYRNSARQRLLKSSRIKELDIIIKDSVKERDGLRRELNRIDRDDFRQLTLNGFDMDNIEYKKSFLNLKS